MTSADWIEIAVNTVANAGLIVLIAHGVRYIVGALAGAERASFGAFCFMLGAVLIRHDTSAQSAEDVCRFVGGVVALILIYHLWFRAKASTSDGLIGR